MARSFDFDYLRSAFDPCFFMEKAFGIKPDPWQAAFLKDTSKRILLLCSRQSGKSTTSATKALHRAVFTENVLILIISNVLRQAQETFVKLKNGLAFVKNHCGISYETQTMLKLTNGSRILCLPGTEDKIRGFSSVSLLLIDEAARVEDGLYYSIRPMLIHSKGDLVAMSTPFGKRGWFHDAWFGDAEPWSKTKITGYDCPRMTAVELAIERAAMGDWQFEQEYLCVFRDAISKIFSHELFIKSLTSEGNVVVPGQQWAG